MPSNTFSKNALIGMAGRSMLLLSREFALPLSESLLGTCSARTFHPPLISATIPPASSDLIGPSGLGFVHLPPGWPPPRSLGPLAEAMSTFFFAVPRAAALAVFFYGAGMAGLMRRPAV